MQHKYVEVVVGFFVLVGILCFGYMSVRFAKMEIIGGNYYHVFAEFDSASGLRNGADIEVAGVKVGSVRGIVLADDVAVVEMNIRPDTKIQDDAIASIRTRGIIGDKFIKISPGASEKIIKANGKIRETESPIEIEELISDYVFGKV